MRDVYREDHEQFRTQVRRFIEENVVPFHSDWEKEGVVPRSLWRKAGEEGMLLTSIPEEYGGSGGDFGHSAIMVEELARVNASGIGFTLHSDIAAPYILAYAQEEQKRKWLAGMARGEIISALAITEPGTGSDVKAIRTRATLDDDDYVINGQKTFITNGISADLVIVATKTDVEAGSRGVSLICVEGGTRGFSKGRQLEKIGLKAQDTAELFFEDTRVPIANRLGEENAGFGYLMHNLSQERLVIAIRAAASIESMFAHTVAYTKERKAFGRPIFEYQNSRFKLAEAKARMEMLRTFVDDCLGKHLRGELTPDRAAMAKLLGAELQGQLLDDFLQLHGGYGYMKEYPIGGAWLDARIMRIYGGTSEIMKEIIARTL